jgi:arabinose-5-phosphate isomerase
MKREIPICNPEEKFADVIMAITRGGLGLAVVVYDKRLMGVITDGDLRRALASGKTFEQLNASQIMSSNPLAVSEEDMFSDAENIMLDNEVTSLVVIGETGEVSGVVKLQDAKIFK